MTNRINTINPNVSNINFGKHHESEKKNATGFGKFLSDVADGALNTIDAVGTIVPGGGLLSAAAKGLKYLKNGDSDLSRGDQMDKMWAMQRENQVFNLQYMQLQQSMQSDNRHFSTMSNLLKARHDTAKAAINNMHV